MKALFISRNLIGDALNIAPALRKWYEAHQDWEVTVQTLPDHTECLYSHMGIPVKVITDDSQREFSYDFIHTFDCGAAFNQGDKYKIHIGQAYGKLLGVDLQGDVNPVNINPVYIPDEEMIAESLKDRILISPFSRSCASQSGQKPNKMLPWKEWQPIVKYLRSFDYQIGILGAEGDRAQGLDVSEDEYFTGLSLNTVALILKYCRFLVTIDNGIAHLAATQNTRMFEMYPQCLGLHWIAPWGNPNAVICQLDPATVDAIAIIMTMKKSIEMLLGEKPVADVAGFRKGGNNGT